MLLQVSSACFLFGSPGLEPGVTLSQRIFLVLKLKVSSSQVLRLQPTLWFALCHRASST